MTGFEEVALIAALAGTAVSAGASIYRGSEEQKAQYEAAHQDEIEGKEEFAASQREAHERELEGKLLISRQMAAAAASGGGAGDNDPTIVRLLTKTAERTQYGIESVRYQGQRRRNTLETSARNRRKSGDSSYLGGWLSAAGSVASGAGDYAKMRA